MYVKIINRGWSGEPPPRKKIDNNDVVNCTITRSCSRSDPLIG